MAFPLKNRKLFFFLTILILLTILEIGYFFYLKQRSKPLKREDAVSSTEKKESLDALVLKANKVNQETVLQQATMSASAKDTLVPEGCNKLPYADPLVGIFQYKKTDKERNNTDYIYLGKIINISEERRGNCNDSIIVLEYQAGGNPKQISLRIPRQMIGTGSLGAILPKVLTYKQGLRIHLSINYSIFKDYLIINNWKVINLLLN